MKKLVLTFVAIVSLVPAVSTADNDAKKPASKDKPYKLETCIVSDEKLGEMGDPFVTSYKGQEIKMCCKACNKDFTKNPDKYLKKLTEAAAPKK